MQQNAILVTDGKLGEVYGKTSHGLITGRSRYPISAVIDPVHVGKDAGEVVDGKQRKIPVFATVTSAMTALAEPPTLCIIGVATPGGYLSASLTETLKEAISFRLNIVNGLHQFVSEHPILKPHIEKAGVDVLDIRKPKTFAELHPWTGKISEINTPRIAVLGMDCAIGKRTTCTLLYESCNKAGIRTEMIYTGQTGWLQGFQYGFILDSTLNDFVSGELEHAIVTCAHESDPDLILLEGQSGLRNPSGPCGAEYICSGGVKGVILHYPVGRKYFDHAEKVKIKLPPITEEIELIRLYGAKVLGITMNTNDLSSETWQQAKERIQSETGLPVCCPRTENIDLLLPVIKKYMLEIGVSK